MLRHGPMIALVALAACTPSNKLMPLRGEDPQALALSGERVDWLERTGATEAVRALREELLDEEWGRAASMLGPATRTAVARRAAEVGKEPADVVAARGVPGLGLPGADDPVAALSARGRYTVAEPGPFDARRRSVRVVLRIEGRPEPIEVPVVFTEDGWQVELVRVLETAPVPAPAPGE
ncbi:MAG: hypothetical protein FJ087_00630 [Deltaproteobacteria bacterium]|nr:hypothetical protein [Deltaproteobacteria bacterium]